MTRIAIPWALAACLSLPAAAQEKGKSETVPIPGTRVKFDLVSIPGGTFKGVELKPFWMGRHEVTWGEFDLYYGTPKEAEADGVTRPTKCKEYFGQAGVPPHFMEAPRPVICPRWHSAMGYCHFVSRKTGHLYRLPTEAEWEYACGAAAGEAWCRGNSEERTHVGGEKKPNAFGLHDMLGNVWEYCLEPFAPPDFSPVLRGGAWNTPAGDLKSTLRRSVPEEWFGADPNRPRSVWWLTADFSQGFRLVRVCDASDAREREAYASRIEVRILKDEERIVKVGAAAEFYQRVWGEVKNAGDRALDELHVLVYYLDAKGKPHLADLQGANKPGQATFAYVFPALVNSAWPGGQARPMKPGEMREFAADIPQSFDNGLPGKFAGHAVGVVFSPK